jgi:predicted nucleic acid-binding Zn ribbon protein
MRGEIQSIGEIIDAMVARLGLKQKIKRARVVEEWPRLVGEIIARQTRTERIREDTLFVIASSPVWAQELELMKPKLLQKIRQEIGKGVITDIRFKAGKI